MNAPKIFDHVMIAGAGGGSGSWNLKFGEWRFVVMPAVTKANGWWWAVEFGINSAMMKSDYAETSGLAASAVETYVKQLSLQLADLTQRHDELGRSISISHG